LNLGAARGCGRTCKKDNAATKKRPGRRRETSGPYVTQARWSQEVDGNRSPRTACSPQPLFWRRRDPVQTAKYLSNACAQWIATL